MGIPYQAFSCKRIVFCAFALAFFLSFPPCAQAYDDLYVIEGVKVDVTAENSVAARDQALQEAQVVAFEMLAARMVAGGQNRAVQTPDLYIISTLIQDFEITDEQLSAVRYIGTYTIRFKEEAVSRYFSGTGVAYTDRSSKPVLVLPFYRQGNRNVIWSEENLWMQAWSRANLSRGLVPVEVPIGDLMDVADLGEAQGLNYDARRLRAMLGRYGAEEAALMLAAPDEKGASVSVSVYRTDRGRPERVHDFTLQADPGQTLLQLYDRAVLQAHGVLQEDWKRKTVASAADGGRIHARVPFSGLKEWVQIQQVLRNTSGVDTLSILSVSPREAFVELRFRGDETRLRQVLAQGNMSLSSPRPKSAGQQFKDPQGRAQEPSQYYDLLWGKRSGESFFQNNVEPAAGNGEFGVQTF